VLSLGAFLTAWELIGRSVDPLLFAPPSRVGSSFAELYGSGELLAAAAVTINTLLVGYGLAIAVGIPVGVLLAQWRMVGAVVEPYFYGIFSTPRVVIVPLIIVWFGVGYGGRLLLVFVWSMIAIATSTADGVRNARPDLVEVARSFGVRRGQIVRHVLLPGSVPFVVSGLRIGAERAVVGVIIGEMFLELTGLGGLIQTSAQGFETPAVLCAVVTIAVIGTVLLAGLDALERRVSRWKERPG
jgi:NitT/TauT family transport system permease protein